ncbi:MAG: hypothetical protein K5864_06315 [Bacteroidales bacterium]|nr:hypothetical protein [Bacteroidales bacterium]
MSTSIQFFFNKKAFLVLAALGLLTLTSCRSKPKQQDYYAWMRAAATNATKYAVEKNGGDGEYVLGKSNIPEFLQICDDDKGTKAMWGYGLGNRYVNTTPYELEGTWEPVSSKPYLIVSKKCKMNRWDREAFCQVLFYSEEELQELFEGKSYTEVMSRSTNNSFETYDKVVEFVKTHKPYARYVFATGSMGKGIGKAHTVVLLKEGNYDIATLKGFEFTKSGNPLYMIVTNICRLGSHYLGWFMWIVGVVLLCIAFALLKKSTLIDDLKFGDKALRKRFPVSTSLKGLLSLCLFFSLSVGITAGLSKLDNYKMVSGLNSFLADLVELGFGLALILLVAFVIVGLVKKHPFKNLMLALLGVLVAMLGLAFLAQPFGLAARLLGWLLFIVSLPLLIRIGGAAIGGIIDGELDETTYKLEDGTVVHGRGSHFEDDSGFSYTRNGDKFTKNS